MKIYEYSEEMHVDFSAAVVALGLFDGVHKGHQALLSIAKKEAEKLKIPLVVFTFFSENELPKGVTRLYSTEVKSELLQRAGADFIVYADFSKIAGYEAEDFVRDIIINKLGARLAVTGTDFRFGKNRAGDTKLLAEIMQSFGKAALLVPDEIVSETKISTSLIKELLKNGDTRLASELLGEPYFIEGEIVHGDSRGETLGLPTVNISLQSDKSFIKLGVYQSAVEIDGKSYTGLTNIGKCPTFKEREVHAETFILDFSENVYGKRARVALIDYLREEKKFKDKDELTEQIQKDIASVKERQKNVRHMEQTNG